MDVLMGHVESRFVKMSPIPEQPASYVWGGVEKAGDGVFLKDWVKLQGTGITFRL